MHAVSRHLLAVALTALLLTGCSESIPAPSTMKGPEPTAVTTTPDPDLPASAVLPYVPESTALLTVTDYQRVALQLGVDLSSRLSKAQRDDFWRRARTETALLSPGLLRDDEDTLLADYGFGQEDVAWEAHLAGDDGTETGWVLRFRDGVSMDEVEKAIRKGVGPLAGAEVVDGTIVVKGPLPDPDQSWATDAEIAPLIGSQANGVVVRRGCVTAPAGTPRVEDLTAYSLTFEGSLATARLGLGRTDLFTRLRLAEGSPAFKRLFTDGVADPTTGRLGFEMTNASAATDATLRESLPFAVCRG